MSEAEEKIVLDSEPVSDEYTVQRSYFPAFEKDGKRFPEAILFTQIEKDDETIYMVNETWIKKDC